jgi:putative addiction module killer protein
MIVLKRTKVYDRWFNKLKDVRAQAKIVYRTEQIKNGIFGDFKYISDGIFESRIHYGPGYRIYYTKEGDTVVLLLIGGDKSTQQKDIEKAKEIKNAKR